MIPFGRERVTLFHRVETTGADGRSLLTWQRMWLDGCSWRHAARYSLSNADEVVCRVPVGQMRPSVGDGMVLGSVNDEVESAVALAELLEEYRLQGRAFRVAAVNDNMRSGFPLAHYAARGK